MALNLWLQVFTSTCTCERYHSQGYFILGRIQKPLSLRRPSMVLQQRLLPVVVMLEQQSSRVKKEPTSSMVKWREGTKNRNSWIAIYLKPYKGLTPARRSRALILALCSYISKGIATVSNPISFKKNGRHACMQVSRTNQKQYIKHDDIQGSLTDNVRKR